MVRKAQNVSLQFFSVARCLPVLTLSMGLCSNAFAQAEPEPSDTNADIIVTSLRYSERLLDAPGAVTVFDSQEIARSVIRDLRGIADRTPNFGLLDNYRPGLERFQMRGIITPQVGDPPLAFVIDDVTVPDPQFATEPLFQLDQVEILRGAQGALYGRSAVGGTVNIRTRAPSDRFELSASGSYESGDTRRFEAALSGPVIAERVHFRLAGYRVHSDGLINNQYLDRGADFRDDFALLGQFAFQLGPRTSFDLRARYSDARDGIGYYDPVSPSQPSIEDFSIGTSQNVLGVNNRESYYFSSKLEHDFGVADLIVAGGYFHAFDRGVADGDLVALASDGATFFPSSQLAVDDLDAWNLEARIRSKADAAFTWTIGTYYQHRKKFSSFAVFDDSDGTQSLSEAQIVASPELFSIYDLAKSRTLALSAEANYAFTQTLSVTLAGRYDHDRRSSVDPRDAITTYARETFDQFQPKATLSYKPTSESLFYLSYSRGFRSGGFNQFSPVVPRFFPAETTNSYEAGSKLSLLDNALALSAAIFRNDQTNAQITRFNAESFTLENVPIDDVRSQGAELEITAILAPKTTFGASVGYTDSEIRRFDSNPAVAGASMPYVPEYTLALSLDHEETLSDQLHFWVHAGFRMVGGRSFTLDFPDLKSKSHEFVDLTTGLKLGDWGVSVYADNLFDERQVEDLFAVFNGAVELARQPNRGRRLGISIQYSNF